MRWGEMERLRHCQNRQLCPRELQIKDHNIGWVLTLQCVLHESCLIRQSIGPARFVSIDEGELRRSWTVKTVVMRTTFMVASAGSVTFSAYKHLEVDK